MSGSILEDLKQEYEVRRETGLDYARLPEIIDHIEKLEAVQDLWSTLKTTLEERIANLEKGQMFEPSSEMFWRAECFKDVLGMMGGDKNVSE